MLKKLFQFITLKVFVLAICQNSVDICQNIIIHCSWTSVVLLDRQETVDRSRRERDGGLVGVGRVNLAPNVGHEEINQLLWVRDTESLRISSKTSLQKLVPRHSGSRFE